MANVLYYSTFLITVGLVMIAAFGARAAIIKGKDRNSCTHDFTVKAVLAGITSGFPIFYGAIWLFEAAGYRVNFGHGEALIAAPIFNFFLGIAGAVIGRIVLGWSSIKW